MKKIETPPTLEAFEGLRGNPTERRLAYDWLAAPQSGPGQTTPARDRPRPCGPPETAARSEARGSGPGIWATMEIVPALAAASWSDDAAVSGQTKLALTRLEDADPKARAEIAEAIERGRDVAPLDGIQLALAALREKDPAPRLSALDTLGKGTIEPKVQDEVASALLAMLGDRNPVIREKAVAALGLWSRPGDHRQMAVLLEDSMQSVRAATLKALASDKDPEMIATIVSLPERASVAYREIEGTVRGYGPVAEPALLDALAKGTGTREKQAIFRMLAAIGTEKCLPALREAQEDRNRTVATSARQAVSALEQRLGLSPSTPPEPEHKARPRPARKNTRTMPNAPKRGDSRASDPDASQ